MHMTHVWVSPSLPADPGVLAQALGPGYDVLTPSAEPPFGQRLDDQLNDQLSVGSAEPAEPAGADLFGHRPRSPLQMILVVTMYERELLATLTARPAGAVLVLVTPPGVDVPPDLGAAARPQLVGAASSVADVAALIRSVPMATSVDVLGSAQADAPWWVGSGRPEPYPAGGSTGGSADRPTTVAPAVRAGRGLSRRGGLIAAVAVLAVVLGTSAAVMAAAGGGGGTSQAANDSTPADGLSGYGTRGGQFSGGEFPGGRLPGGGFPGGGRFRGGNGPAIDLEKLQACLKDKGITLDGSNGQPRPDMTDSTVREAFRQCTADLRGSVPSAGASGGAPSAGVPGDDQSGGSGGGTTGGSSATGSARPATFVVSAVTLT